MSTPLRLRDLGDQVTAICKAHRIMKRDVARNMDVSGSFLSQLLTRGASPEQIEKIAEALSHLGARVDGQPITAWHFDSYNAATIGKAAKMGDLNALLAIKLYAASTATTSAKRKISRTRSYASSPKRRRGASAENPGSRPLGPPGYRGKQCLGPGLDGTDALCHNGKGPAGSGASQLVLDSTRSTALRRGSTGSITSSGESARKNPAIAARTSRVFQVTRYEER